jgi:hypothetical protein
MANEWHYTLNGQQAATPISTAQLKQLAASGQLQPNDMVWQEGMTGWMPASSIKGLFPPGRVAAEPAPALLDDRAGRRPQRPAGPPREWQDMHPLVVLVLTVCTFGIFGLVYSFKVCLDYGRTRKRETDGAARPLGRVRHPLWVLLWSYLSCGFYFYYWIYRILVECGDYSGKKDGRPQTELSLMLLCPPYAVYLIVFRVPEVIRRCQTLAGLPETHSLTQAGLFLNPCLFLGLPFLAMMYQEALNQIWFNAP